MNSKQRLELDMKMCREEWFKNHVASLHVEINNPDQTLLIKWQNPASWNYGCRFIVHRRWLCVVGDIGEATYEWSQDLSLEFLGKIDFHYFAGKCRSSEVGRNYVGWDSEVAADAVTEWLSQNVGDGDTSGLSTSTIEDIKRIDKQMPKDEYDEICRDIYNDSRDGELASMFSEFGEVPDNRCVGHFIGLQMAIEQIMKPKQS